MNNNIFNRSILILIFLSFVFSNNLLAKQNSCEKNQQFKKKEAPKSSLILLKNYYKYDFGNNYRSISKNIFSSEKQIYNKKSPWLAFGLAMSWPGLGQVYNGEYGKLAILYGVAILGAGLFLIGLGKSNYGTSKPETSNIPSIFAGGGLVLFFLAWLYSVVDAPISANKINERNRQARKINVFSSINGKYSINLGNSKFNKSYSVGMQFNF